MNNFYISPIGIALSPYKQKFGIPRQSGVIPEVPIEIILNQNFSEHAVRGIQEFEYIWIQYIFHENIKDGWSELVRPPKLGGKIKKGVFATRSPHRPNFIGLSLLKLEKITLLDRQICLYCTGGDLLDQTPIIDIKPYLAHFEVKEIQQTNFSLHNKNNLIVIWNEKEKDKIQDTNLIKVIETSLAQDPRPAYQKIEDRIYVTKIGNLEISFQIIQDKVYIKNINIISS